ncbi:Ger(x)C family spore germination protein [Lysinibacillus sp. KU-BSD001]|uniref:Ger(x)C family spore germination protein n=1 Tax=Lysinibacillus sp. KU-BSD001 TaxID=3141328 RepID=UPI0036E35035
MKKWWSIVLSAIIMSGCWDVREPERMYYVFGVGVDYVDEEYIVYMQLIDFTNVAKTEQPNPEVVQTEIGIARGATIAKAFFNMYHSLDMRLFWGHLSFVVLSNEALKEGRANLVVDSFNRYRETRYEIWVYGTGDDLSELMLVAPVLNKPISLSKLTIPFNSFSQDSFLVPIDFRQFNIALNEPNYSIAIPYIKLSKDWKSQKETQKAIEFEGVAITARDGLKEIFKEEEIEGLRFMNNETKRGQLTYSINDKPVTVVVENIKVNVKATPKNEKFVFDVTIKLDAIASDFHTEITKKQIQETVIKEVEKKVEETYQHALKNNIDIYNLSNYAYKQNVKHWKQVEKDGQVPLDADSIASIEVYIEKLSAARKEFTETIKEE